MIIAKSPQPKIRVLIIDDSAVVRSVLTSLLAADPGIEVVGSATDPYIARDKVIALKPDVITLDVEMPRMDGITFLQALMRHHPVRTVIISSLTKAGSDTYFKAFEAGAIDVIEKPSLDVTQSLMENAAELIARVRAAAGARLQNAGLKRLVSAGHAKGPPPLRLTETTHQILAFAASTGGTEALKAVLSQLPHDIPGTVIVQHMPPVFTKSFASHLAMICPFEVKEAEVGDKVIPGRALVAPGNYHMEIVRSGGYYHIKLNQDPTQHGVRPAADKLFHSVAKHAGANAIGVILTGMGHDGADGLLAMRAAGSINISQDEATSVVYGMPKAAVDLGAIDLVRPLGDIAREITVQLHKTKRYS